MTRRATLAAAVGTPALLGLAAGSYEVAARTTDDEDFETPLLCPLADGQSSLEGDRTALSADPRLLSAYDLSEGQQVRVERRDDEFAAYTIVEERPEDPTDIIRAADVTRCRLDLEEATPPAPGDVECPSPDQNCSLADDEFEVTLSTTIPNPDLSESQAREQGELIERLDERGTDRIFLAPHGGAVQPWTDDQAEYAAELTASTCWRTKGWGPDGGNAFRRWHVPTMELSPESYPELETIADTEYDLAVDCSGVCDAGVLVGGTADRDLRETVRDSINDALPRCAIEAELEDDGTSDRMLVNRLGEESIYLSQSYDSRRAYWEEVAHGLAAALSDDVEPPEQDPPCDRGNAPSETPPEDRGNAPSETPPEDRGNAPSETPPNGRGNSE
ncbi:Orc1/cdc6 family replication initiation protein [Natrarchaeobaculum sulfurireducens]|uniref:Orc1/cdc6 family replication initiation protein n=1 Tax=Natrarchaeobaculum sulfurireducens TaxID=2044521 RepID=A0A346PHR1_9EURY|nr:Orc1/cdc6 family replication initiation protein [Natrarchaeobaculum sulfurireducens]